MRHISTTSLQYGSHSVFLRRRYINPPEPSLDLKKYRWNNYHNHYAFEPKTPRKQLARDRHRYSFGPGDAGAKALYQPHIISPNIPRYETAPAAAPYPPPLPSLLGTARANIAATSTAPYGTATSGHAARHADRTVLQQHCDFFDTDHDGIVWPRDTYVGLRALGINIFFSLLWAIIVHLNFSFGTTPHRLPDPFFRIYLDRIYKDKHGSDSGTYDNEGRFIPQNFEDFWSKYGNSKAGTMDKWQLWRAVRGQRDYRDPIGWGITAFEWFITWIYFWPKDGVLRKEEVRGIFDGSGFYERARRVTGRKWPERGT
jgi:peroxygenase